MMWLGLISLSDPRVKELIPLDQILLFFLQVLDHLDWDVERGGDEVGRGQGEPLGQADVGEMIALVDFDPDQLLRVRRVFNVVAW